MSITTGISKGPVIHEFKASNYAVPKGGSFVLSWSIEADKADLYRNGSFYQTLGNSQQSLERTEFYDSDKDVTYEIVAVKNGVQARSKAVVIKCITSASSTADISKYLLQSVPWAKFTGIAGIIICSVIVILSLITSLSSPESYPVLLTIIPCLALLFPIIFLLRFAGKLKPALAFNDNSHLMESFKNLKSYFKSMGILIIIYLTILLVALVVILINL